MFLQGIENVVDVDMPGLASGGCLRRGIGGNGDGNAQSFEGAQDQADFGARLFWVATVPP